MFCDFILIIIQWLLARISFMCMFCLEINTNHNTNAIDIILKLCRESYYTAEIGYWYLLHEIMPMSVKFLLFNNVYNMHDHKDVKVHVRSQIRMNQTEEWT